MNFLPTLPDWLPWWVPLVLLVPALLYALAFLFMPFSVIGVKTRIDVLEARLDEIQHEIRLLALRMTEPGRQVDFDEIADPDQAELSLRAPPMPARPPIPPASHELHAGSADRPPPTPGSRPVRREPRIDWPR